MEKEKDQSFTSKEKQNTYQYIMRYIDIYGEPLNWFIGNHQTYNTTVGGCRTFIVFVCAFIFLIYTVYNLFHDRNGSFLFYDITYPEIEDAQFYYYKDFEIFFFFQSSGREWMIMDTDIFQVSLIQTTASDDDDEEEDSDSTLRNLNVKKKRKRNKHIFYKNKNNKTILKKLTKNKNKEKIIFHNKKKNQILNNNQTKIKTNQKIETDKDDNSNKEEFHKSNNYKQLKIKTNKIRNTQENENNQLNESDNNNNNGSNESSNNNEGNINESGSSNDYSGSTTTDSNNDYNSNNSEYINDYDSSEEDDDEILAYYNFTECDNEYFTNELGFSATIGKGLSTTYCFDYNLYKDTTINYTLSPISPLGESTNPMIFEFVQVCSSDNCTNEENNKFKKVINSIRNLKVFIKTYIPNPLSINEPIQSQVLTFTLTKRHKGTTLYFKTTKISTDSSLIPYIVGPKNLEFLQYDYFEDDYEESITDTYFLNFALSYKKTYLDRTYDKLDTALANFMAIFNALEVVGKILTFFFASFSKEFFMFNYILRDRIYIKQSMINKEYIHISNPPKITYNNNLVNSNPSIHSNYDLDSNLNINYKLKSKINKDTDSKTSSIERKIGEKIIVNPTSENLKNDIIQNNTNEEEKINLSLFQNFWCNILMSIDSDNSKYKSIDNALKKIRLVQDFFDTSIYINTIIDMIRLKKILFDENQLILFENIHFTCDELQNYMLKISNNKDQYNDNEIKKLIFKMENERNNKLTKSILNIIKKQINY